ncbi:hypothetical protein VKT23_008474 [Stygiomarasmius scandens]|uniref:Xylanolytic transcriptional activator regulatory domain-containing protein n=1 Tax=Marasmiellus scandens TaxID=2682957 RepID=A0ABR1JIU4_9AGAR
MSDGRDDIGMNSLGDSNTGMGIDGRDNDRDRDGDGDNRVKGKNGGRDVIDAFGTLSISDHGISRFFGPTGGSESLLADLHRRFEEEEEEKEREKNNAKKYGGFGGQRRSRSRSMDAAMRASGSPLSLDGKDDDAHSSSLSPPTSNNTTSPSLASVGTGATSVFSVGNQALIRSQAPGASQALPLFSATFPFTPLGLPTAQIMSMIQDYLPDRRRAEELVEIYYAQLAWLFRGVGRDQVEEMIWAIYSALGKLYGRAGDRGWESDEDERNPTGGERGRSRHWDGEAKSNRRPDLESDYQGPHDLALLFMVFAAAALVEPEPEEDDEDEQDQSGAAAIQIQHPQNMQNPNMIIRIGDGNDGANRSNSGSAPTSPPYTNAQPGTALGTAAGNVANAGTARASALAEHYHQLAQAALSLQPVLEKPSIVTIQVLHLMSIYNAMSGNEIQRDGEEEDDGDNGERGGRSKSRGGKGRGRRSSKSKSVGRDGRSKTRGRRRRKGDDTSEASMEMTWSLITMAAHLSQTIGLHRDSARWGLSPKMVQRRRVLFWDLFVADVWQSLNTGRPPSFSLAYIDCAFPVHEDMTEKDGKTAVTGDEEDKAVTGAQSKPGIAFGIWQFRFAAECVAEVTSRTLTAEAPTYATIMELDRKVREFPLPEGFGPDSSNANNNASPPKDEDMAMSFQRCVMDHIRETVLMYIHRAFFAQALIDHPTNPLKSHYAPSFLAAYRASATILKSIREQFAIWPITCGRFWTMWTFAFTAAVVFGTVVTRGPRSPLAQSAMTELEQACVLFSRAAVYSRRATKALPILTKLREKARLALSGPHMAAPTTDLSLTHSALSKMSTSASPLTGINSELWQVQKDNEMEDALSIFAGHTRFVSSKPRPQSVLPPTSEMTNGAGDMTAFSAPGGTMPSSLSPSNMPDMMSGAGSNAMGSMNMPGGHGYGAPGNIGQSMSGVGSAAAIASGSSSMDHLLSQGSHTHHPPYQSHSRRASRVRGPYDVDVDMDMSMNLEVPIQYQPPMNIDAYGQQHGLQSSNSSGPPHQSYDQSQRLHQYQLPPPRAMQPPFHSQPEQINRPPAIPTNPFSDSSNNAWTRQPSREDTIRPEREYPSRDYAPGYYRDVSQPRHDYHRRDYSQSRGDYPMHSAPPNPPTISIPPTIAIPPAPMSAPHERTSSPSRPMQFSYSYDRSSRSGSSSASGMVPPASASAILGSGPEVNISGSRGRSVTRPSVSQSQHSTSPIRLTQPQYAPNSAQHVPMDMNADVYRDYSRSRAPSHHQPSQHHPGYPYPPQPHELHGPGVQGVPGNAALADLGLAARDSRLDERWSSFMEDSGILDDVGYGRR